jgi:hypothetical protein
MRFLYKNQGRIAVLPCPKESFAPDDAGLPILLYTDDAIFIFENILDNARNFKINHVLLKT